VTCTSRTKADLQRTAILFIDLSASGAELRNQYILGYHPSNKSHDARWRKIKVKRRAPKGLPPLSVYAKTGYYAPIL